MPATKRPKAMQVALDFKGVEYVAIHGTGTNRIVVLGEDIDFDRLTKKLRRKVGHWNIYGVDEVNENWKNAAEQENLDLIAFNKKELELYRSNDPYYTPPFDGENFDQRLRPRCAHAGCYINYDVIDPRYSYNHPPLPPPPTNYPPVIMYADDYPIPENESCTIL